MEALRLRDLTAELDSLPKGMGFARYIVALTRSGDDVEQAAKIAETRWGKNAAAPVTRALRMDVTKASVTALQTSDGQSALTGYAGLVTAFLGAMTPRTVIGRLPGLVRVPFNTSLVLQSDTSAGSWVGQGKAIPVARLSVTAQQLPPFKTAALNVFTEELLNRIGGAAESFVLSELVAKNVRTLDAAFLDWTNAGIVDIKPAAVTYNAPGLTSTGNTVAAITANANAVARQLVNLGSDLTTAAWVMNPQTAAYLATLPGSGGSPAWPTMSMRGGFWFGLPVLTSNALSLVGSPGVVSIALIDGARILIADDGEAEVTTSKQATIQMLDNPTNDVTTPTATQMVSMFHTDSVAVRTIRRINWMATPGAAAVIRDIEY